MMLGAVGEHCRLVAVTVRQDLSIVDGVGCRWRARDGTECHRQKQDSIVVRYLNLVDASGHPRSPPHSTGLLYLQPTTKR